MQNRRRRPPMPAHPGNSSPNVTSAVGLQETAGRLRARRSSLFTQTVIWVTGLVCLALLLSTLAQAWSNSQLMQQVQGAQQQLQRVQDHHAELTKLANHYQDPYVIESEARQQLGYIRPGEHPVIIISATNPTRTTVASSSTAERQQSYWQEWWNAFFGS